MQISTIASNSKRFASIDILRGTVMIIMALDHVREFFHHSARVFDPLDLRYTSVFIFSTRWITHFCAPVFVFLAGTSAFLTLQRKGQRGLSWFLFTRGLWLVIAELTVVNFGFDFLQIFSVVILETIWALGISMIALSVLLYLPKPLLLIIALVIVAGHDSLDNIRVTGNSATSLIWSLLHQPNLFVFGKFRLLVAYPVLPWIGVMALGYCFGEFYRRYSPSKRIRIFLALGIISIIIFVALRSTNLYGDPAKWSHQKNTLFTLLSFINTSKYPPSLLFILMTLGPAILFLAFVEIPLNKITNLIAVYGRVPLFYFIVHIFFIHIAYILIGIITATDIGKLFRSNLIEPIPEFGFKLWIVYVIWIAIVALLFPLCKWYDAYKTANKQKWWLSYL